MTIEKARELVRMLRDHSHDPDQPGECAIASWRTEAAAHGDLELCAAIDAHPEELLVRLWDDPMSEWRGAERCR